MRSASIFFHLQVVPELNISFLSLFRRQVDAIEGDRLAKSNDCAFVETSAKNNVNVGASVSVLPRFAHSLIIMGFLLFRQGL